MRKIKLFEEFQSRQPANTKDRTRQKILDHVRPYVKNNQDLSADEITDIAMSKSPQIRQGRYMRHAVLRVVKFLKENGVDSNITDGTWVLGKVEEPTKPEEPKKPVTRVRVNIPNGNLEAAQDKNGTVLISMGGMYVGALSFCEVYRDDRNPKVFAKVKTAVLDAFPATDEWKQKCHNHSEDEIQGARYKFVQADDEDRTSDNSNLKQDMLIVANKERSSSFRGNTIEGKVQLWDESLLKHSTSIGGPFQDVHHEVSGTYVGGIYFAAGLHKQIVNKVTEQIKKAFPEPVPKRTGRWIESN